ncbi:hypothetical protein [Nocardioides convexus]|uniref:phage portal protein family protein n=1 Tax=Nocardioides convexus TaxID=2712224 RepID=UPI002418637F|nr:hypothetical protein [Nocardioides convexus]
MAVQQMITDSQVAHLAQPSLDIAAKSAITKYVGDTQQWDRRNRKARHQPARRLQRRRPPVVARDGQEGRRRNSTPPPHRAGGQRGAQGGQDGRCRPRPAPSPRRRLRPPQQRLLGGTSGRRRHPPPTTPPPEDPSGSAATPTRTRASGGPTCRASAPPSLRWPQCLEVFEAMVDQDGMVDSTLSALVTPILRAGWRIDGTGCRPEVTAHVAGDLGLPIVGQGTEAPRGRTRGRFSWTEHLAIAVPDHLQYGHAPFEQVYHPPGADGLYHLRKAGYRPPRSIAAWNIARDGGLISIQQHPPGYASPGVGGWISTTPGNTLPVNRLVVYVHRKKGSNWPGRSVLRPGYKNWLLKDRFLRLLAQVAERNGMGLPVYTAATNDQGDIDAGEEISAAARAGDDAGISLPHDAKFALQGVTGTLPDLLANIRYQDEQIARSMLANVLNLGQARGTGSWALGVTLNDVLSLAIEAIAENIRDTATSHIIEDLVDLNYGPDEPAPRLVYDEIGSKTDGIIGAVAQARHRRRAQAGRGPRDLHPHHHRPPAAWWRPHHRGPRGGPVKNRTTLARLQSRAQAYAARQAQTRVVIVRTETPAEPAGDDAENPAPARVSAEPVALRHRRRLLVGLRQRRRRRRPPRARRRRRDPRAPARLRRQRDRGDRDRQPARQPPGHHPHRRRRPRRLRRLHDRARRRRTRHEPRIPA